MIIEILARAGYRYYSLCRFTQVRHPDLITCGAEHVESSHRPEHSGVEIHHDPAARDLARLDQHDRTWATPPAGTSGEAIVSGNGDCGTVAETADAVDASTRSRKCIIRLD